MRWPLAMHSGNTVWICGPHRGAKHDTTIFKENSKQQLEENEMAEGEKGCIDADWIRSKEDCATVKEHREKGRLRN